MKHFAFVLFALLVSGALQGKNPVRNATTAAYQRHTITDTYLSPLPYSGWSVNVQNRRQQMVGEHWLQQWGGQAQFGRLLNAPCTNRLTLWGIESGWGMGYQHTLLRNLTLMGGGYANIDYVGKLLNNNVNRPYSMDLSCNLHASAAIGYTVSLGRIADISATYQIRTPLAGVFFAPEVGGSYYELMQSVNNTMHVGSLHNQWGVHHGLLLDVQFKGCSWRLGVEHDYLKYTANDLTFSRENVAFSLGWIALLDIQRGKQNTNER